MPPVELSWDIWWKLSHIYMLFCTILSLCRKGNMLKSIIVWLFNFMYHYTIKCLPGPINNNAFPIYLCVSVPSWRPYLFGAGCFSIKTPWWVFPIHSQHALSSLQQTTAFIPSFIFSKKFFLFFFLVYSSTLWEEPRDGLFFCCSVFVCGLAVWLFLYFCLT